jgi:hypothetical protein
MSIFSLAKLGVFALVAGIGTLAMASPRVVGPAPMTAAFERGDLDDASRQGVLAGPVVVEASLASPVRATQLAAVLAAPAVEDRAELLPALATLAQAGDRRTAIPAARAARAIARELAQDELPDDLDTDDVATWRALFEQLATNTHRFIEVRVLALDTVASLGAIVAPGGLGFDLAAALADRDPAFRAAAIALVPRPTPAAAREPLAKLVQSDADDVLALAAASVLCGDDREPAQTVLGAQGIDRVKKLVGGKPPRAVRDARRCLEH